MLTRNQFYQLFIYIKFFRLETARKGRKARDALEMGELLRRYWELKALETALGDLLTTLPRDEAECQELPKPGENEPPTKWNELPSGSGSKPQGVGICSSVKRGPRGQYAKTRRRVGQS